MAQGTIFYSWQSDLPNSSNRGFIEDCLRRAVEELDVEELDVDPSIDRDTLGVAGTPDISGTIFDKIANAAVFVGDVSLIHPKSPDGDTSEHRPRRTPNPNVLIELGYAASKLGWDRIVLVHNLSTGPIEQLPFDLRHRRMASYTLTAGEEKTAARTHLTGLLHSAIDTVLRSPEKREIESLQEILSELGSVLVEILILGEEADDRMIRPWIDGLQSAYKSAADQLRHIAASPAAKREGISEELDNLSHSLDSVAYQRLFIGGGDDLDSAIARVVEQARHLKATQIDARPLSRESVRQIREALLRADHQLQDLAGRAPALLQDARLDDVIQDTSNLGRQILSVAYYKMDALAPDIATTLLSVGHSLHIIETRDLPMDGGASERALLEDLRNASSRFSATVGSLTQERS